MFKFIKTLFKNEIVLILFGTLLSFVADSIYRYITSPKLIICEDTKKSIEDGNLLYAHLRNKPHKLFKCLSRDIAHDCRGKLFFYYLNYEPVFSKGLPIQWHNTSNKNYLTLEEKQFENVAPGTAKGFHILLEFKNENKIIIMSNESNKRILDGDCYYISVKILSSTKPTKAYFKLIKREAPYGYELKLLTKKQGKRVKRLTRKYNDIEQDVY